MRFDSCSIRRAITVWSTWSLSIPSRTINNRAVPTPVTEALTDQSSHVDTVSGAAYTSESYRSSLQSALDAARAAATNAAQSLNMTTDLAPRQTRSPPSTAGRTYVLLAKFVTKVPSESATVRVELAPTRPLPSIAAVRPPPSAVERE